MTQDRADAGTIVLNPRTGATSAPGGYVETARGVATMPPPPLPPAAELDDDETADHTDAEPDPDDPRATPPSTTDFEFARASAIPNVGEDIRDAARHRWHWADLATAEADGTASDMVVRDRLLRAEPHNIMDSVDGAPETAMAMHMAMRCFPPKPGEQIRRAMPVDPAESRAEYLAEYRLIKAEAERLAADAATRTDPAEDAETAYRAALRARDQLQAFVRWRIQERRRGNYYDTTANALVSMSQKLQGNRKANTPGKSLVELAGLATTGEWDLETRQENARRLLEGEPVSKLTGRKAKRGASVVERFEESSMYNEPVRRVGGRDVSAIAGDPTRATAHITSHHKVRAIQWGNTVTDSERAYHAGRLVEAFDDLADVTRLPADAIGLHGQLGVAVGARGRSGAMAHYEPSTDAINLTRKKGVGSLTHEWFHGYDNHIDAGGSAASARREVEKALTPYRARLRTAVGRCVTEGRMTPKKANYWLASHEVLARSFERHVQVSLRDSGRDNTYLSGLSSAAEDSELWPTDDEVRQARGAFDGLFSSPA